MSFIDLHCHTNASDGAFSPEGVVERAVNYKLTHLAITDHDTVKGIKAAQDAACGRISIIPGIEISTTWQHQQIHIVGEYAQKMIAGSEDALKFVDDYFALNYASFLNLYFKGSRQSEIKRNITPAKYRQLFGELSPAQLQIIRDQESKYINIQTVPKTVYNA